MGPKFSIFREACRGRGWGREESLRLLNLLSFELWEDDEASLKREEA